MHGSFGGKENQCLQVFNNMPHYHCCVPGCISRNIVDNNLHFYRIPADPSTRKVYKVILKNDSLKLDSKNTRIFPVHFEGGQKLSRTHLPTIFPWTTSETKRRELKRLSNEETEEIERQKRQKRLEKQQQCSQQTVTTNNNCVSETQTLLTASALERLQNDLEKCKSDLQTCKNNLQTFKEDFQKCQDENLKLKAENERLSSDNKRLTCMNDRLEDLNKRLNLEAKKLHYSLENSRFDIEKFKDSDEDITFYTGFQDYKALCLSYSIIEDAAKHIVYEPRRVSAVSSLTNAGRPRSLTKIQEFILVMMRLRLGLFERDLAHRFNISMSVVSKVVIAWIRFMRREYEPMITIPPRDIVKHYMPEVFKSLFPNVVAIVDCTEFEMEKPSSLNSQSACYSSYKSKTTMKALLAITPSGAVCFVSDLFPGSTSDKEITLQSGFLDKLKPNDQVMADKGFNCTDELVSVGAELIRPAFLDKKHQFSKAETNHNKTVASLRVHVERLMERLKNWHIFDRRIPITMAPIASDMLFVVAALSNFHPPLIN